MVKQNLFCITWNVDPSANLGKHYGMQVLCSSMVFREDVDVGTLMLGDMHKKSPCVQFRVEEIVQNLQHISSIQLHLFNSGLDVENATNDIAPKKHCTRTLLREEMVIALEKPTGTTF